MKAKFWIIRLLFMGAFCLFIFNIYTIQVQEGAYYTERAQAQQSASGAYEVKRGTIYVTDKNNNEIPAVLNKEYPIIFAVPDDIENPFETAMRVSEKLGLDEDDLRKKFTKEGDKYELLVERATQEQVDLIRELDIEGLHVRYETFRFYPFGNMGSHVFGFIAPTETGTIEGRYGIELMQDDVLRGEEGGIFTSSQNGEDIYLTIDRTVQIQAEKVLESLVNAWNADGGSIIVQEPATGKIRTLANTPGFDPNAYYEADLKDYLNTSIEAVYEPGSVFKLITMSAALDSGAVTPQTTYNDVGFVTLNSRTIRNWDLKAHGVQTMQEVLEKSLNTGTIFAEQKTGHDTFYEYVKKFGIGEETGIALPGEVKGSLYNLEHGRDIHYATASFGQGISTTPIAMINAVSAIANGGVLMRPLIRQDEEPEVIRRVIDVDTAHTMRDIMVSAVDENVIAHIASYSVAGKTGTAFIPDFKNGGYSDNVINTFVGFAPASDPQFSILIKLVNPQNAPLAGQTVVPAFRELTQFLLNYYEVAPDRDIES